MNEHLLNKRVRLKDSPQSTQEYEVVAICSGVWGWCERFSCPEAQIEYQNLATDAKRFSIVKFNRRPLVVLRAQRPKTWNYVALYNQEDVDKYEIVGEADFRKHIGDLRDVSLDFKIGSDEYEEVRRKGNFK